MKNLLLSFFLFGIAFITQSQEKSKWELGFYVNPNIPSFEYQLKPTANISNFKSENLLGLGFGNILLYNWRENLKFISNLGLEFYNTKISYIDANVLMNKKVKVAIFSLSAQIDYYPLSNNFNILLAYLPKIVVPSDEETAKDHSFKPFDHSIDIGLGYNFKHQFFNLHPSIRYSKGLNNVWKSNPTTVGQSVQELKLNSLKFIVSFYAPLKGKGEK